MMTVLRAAAISIVLLGTTQPATAIRQFIVFFAEGDSQRLDPVQWLVTAEADAVISGYAAGYREFGGQVVLTAGDQRVGSLEASIERSQRRANAVRDALVAKGIPRSKISTRPCGFVHFLVPTPPETKEPMNRFVSFEWASEDAVLVDGSREGCKREE
jgi:outer membrane protein OmpA-like peptidoglycan-associated protein